MSLGSFFGAVIGGTIGFFVGGPAGMFYGASIGFGIGMAIDPMTPDIPSVGAPEQATTVMQSTIGDPIPDLAGTGKITGHLLAYGKERAVTQYSTAGGGGGKGGGGGGQQTYVSGHKYYMSWVLGIVAGPVDTLYAIYKGEDIVWEGALGCPESGGKETIVLDGVGSIDFYFGTADQLANTKVGEIISDATLNTPYRNMCWAFFDDCYIGEYNRTPTFMFVLKKIPENAFSTKHEIQVYDCNPAHAMWYILHDLAGLPESWLDSVDFAAVAITLSDESRGISILFDRQQSALSYLESINVHIDNIIRYDTGGTFRPKLIRDDYMVEDLPLIDEAVMLEDPTFNRKGWIDTINEVKVQYSELCGGYGTLWAFGYNDYGQLGLGDIINRLYPVQVAMSGDWGFVSCGYDASAAIQTDGTLWTFGRNTYGRLGLGDIIDRFLPTQVGVLTDWSSVACGHNHTAAIKIDGTLWTFGRGVYGQLGLGNEDQRLSPTQVGVSTDWSSVSCGFSFTIAVKTDGTLWSFGRGVYGRLGLGDEDQRLSPTQVGVSTDWSSVSCGEYHAAAIKTDGTLWSFGYNNRGQLGLDDKINRLSPVQVGVSTDWSSVSCGQYHTAAIKTGGALWSFGYNNRGQLGLDDKIDRLSPVQVGVLTNWNIVSCGYTHTVAIKINDTLWAFGRNYLGQLGLDDNIDRLSPVQVGALTDWNIISCGQFHTIAGW